MLSMDANNDNLRVFPTVMSAESDSSALEAVSDKPTITFQVRLHS